MRSDLNLIGARGSVILQILVIVSALSAVIITLSKRQDSKADDFLNQMAREDFENLKKEFSEVLDIPANCMSSEIGGLTFNASTLPSEATPVGQTNPNEIELDIRLNSTNGTPLPPLFTSTSTAPSPYQHLKIMDIELAAEAPPDPSPLYQEFLASVFLRAARWDNKKLGSNFPVVEKKLLLRVKRVGAATFSVIGCRPAHPPEFKDLYRAVAHAEGDITVRVENGDQKKYKLCVISGLQFHPEVKGFFGLQAFYEGDVASRVPRECRLTPFDPNGNEITNFSHITEPVEWEVFSEGSFTDKDQLGVTSAYESRATCEAVCF